MHGNPVFNYEYNILYLTYICIYIYIYENYYVLAFQLDIMLCLIDNTGDVT